jgi:hypothetical protein
LLVIHEKTHPVIGRERSQDRGLPGDVIEAKGADGHEPTDHDRAKELANSSGTAPLNLYEEQVRVPLIIYVTGLTWPARSSASSSCCSSLFPVSPPTACSIPPCYARYPMGRVWRVLGFVLVLSARPALGGECPVSLVGGEPALQRLNAEARLHFIHERLRSDARHARIWSYSWGAIYSALAAGQFVAAPLVSHESGLDLYVGGGAALIGVIPLVVTPLKVMSDERRLDELETLQADPCVALARAEEWLNRDAANEAQGRSLLFHGGNVVFNAGIFFIIGAGFGHWTSATISLLTGIATGEIMIFTQPLGALRALHQYRRGDFGSPSDGVRIGIAPLIAKHGSGMVLILTF